MKTIYYDEFTEVTDKQLRHYMQKRKQIRRFRKVKKLIQKIKRSTLYTIARITLWVLKLHVSPITQRYCDKKLIEGAKKTAIYQLASKAKRFKFTPQVVGGEDSYMSAPPAFGRVFPRPCSFVRYFAVIHSASIVEGLDGVFIKQIADATLAKDRVFFKKCLTAKALERAIKKIDNSSYGDSDGAYLLCITSTERIRNSELFNVNSGKFEICEEYQDYIDRPLYPGEYGRYRIGEESYIVFLTTLDDRMWHAILFGPGALTVLPLEKNLHAIFRRTPAGEAGQQPRGIDVGYQMDIGAAADPQKCVVLEAMKRLEKQ